MSDLARFTSRGVSVSTSSAPIQGFAEIALLKQAVSALIALRPAILLVSFVAYVDPNS